MKKYSVSQAFTLLELLVVMGIIAVLIGLGAVSYSTAQVKARDAKRLGDLKAIQNALEQYYSTCNFVYPFDGSSQTVDLTADIKCTSPAGSTILTPPTDPLGGNYQCINTCDSSTYTICPPAQTNGDYLENGSCSTSDPNCCVHNQQ